ncbi:hypothetical protein L1987_31224 [Smallanthus sonchifolius]|uniref:Uncharacterized protein n=1 Tax=Smallanthus sonchifolius TaxID=185202 RepID=A0ACB9I5P7_9ASTR|nr:hypothetical protein L1987_31224 [Smallanthus sonchifolius]
MLPSLPGKLWNHSGSEQIHTLTKKHQRSKHEVHHGHKGQNRVGEPTYTLVTSGFGSGLPSHRRRPEWHTIPPPLNSGMGMIKWLLIMFIVMQIHSKVVKPEGDDEDGALDMKFCQKFGASPIVLLLLLSLIDAFIFIVSSSYAGFIFFIVCAGGIEKGQIPPKLGGNSHSIYAEEEATDTRFLIDGRTCLTQVLTITVFLTTMSNKVHYKCVATLSAARMILAMPPAEKKNNDKQFFKVCHP